MLKFEDSWRFNAVEKISREVHNKYYEAISKITRGEQKLIEHFKRYFAGAAGITSGWSSNSSWADSDLQNYMDSASVNAPLFIEAFYDACKDLKEKDESIPVPDVKWMNGVLSGASTNYYIEPPYLQKIGSDHIVSLSPDVPLSFEEQARETIHSSLSEIDKLFSEGRHRQAVQEALWLLETVLTAFKGMEIDDSTPIRGKYFNTIIGELKGKKKGQSLDQIIRWLEAMHGYLSSPSGGMVRHGADIAGEIYISESEALLYCNLAKSYISFFLCEYDNLKKSKHI